MMGPLQLPTSGSEIIGASATSCSYHERRHALRHPRSHRVALECCDALRKIQPLMLFPGPDGLLRRRKRWIGKGADADVHVVG